MREDVLRSLADRTARVPQFLGQMRRDLEITLARYGYNTTDEELRVLKNVQRQTTRMSDQELTRALAVGLQRRTKNPPGLPLPVHAGRVLLDQDHREVPHVGDKIVTHLASLATWP